MGSGPRCYVLLSSVATSYLETVHELPSLLQKTKKHLKVMFLREVTDILAKAFGTYQNQVRCLLWWVLCRPPLS